MIFFFFSFGKRFAFVRAVGDTRYIVPYPRRPAAGADWRERGSEVVGIPIPMLDLMFFLTENQDNPRHVGAVLIFQRPRRCGADFLDRIVDAYRRARPVPPFNRIPVLRRIGLPEWQEVDQLDTNYHLQRRPAGAGADAQLDELVAELHAPMLDRSHPGWQVYVIEGLERNRFAVFIKIHHSLVDGESGIALVHRSLSRSPRDRHIRPSSRPACRRVGSAKGFAPASRARGGERRAHGLVDRLGIGARARGMPGGPARILEPGDRPFTAPLTPMNEPIRNARAIAHTVLPLRAMMSVARAWGRR